MVNSFLIIAYRRTKYGSPRDKSANLISRRSKLAEDTADPVEFNIVCCT